MIEVKGLDLKLRSIVPSKNWDYYFDVIEPIEKVLDNMLVNLNSILPSTFISVEFTEDGFGVTIVVRTTSLEVRTILNNSNGELNLSLWKMITPTEYKSTYYRLDGGDSVIEMSHIISSLNRLLVLVED